MTVSTSRTSSFRRMKAVIANPPQNAPTPTAAQSAVGTGVPNRRGATHPSGAAPGRPPAGPAPGRPATAVPKAPECPPRAVPADPVLAAPGQSVGGAEPPTADPSGATGGTIWVGRSPGGAAG